MAARRAPRPTLVWGRSEIEQVSAAVGITTSLPLAGGVGPVALNEATVMRVIGKVWITGTSGDSGMVAILVADEEAFPGISIQGTADMDFMLWEKVMAVPAGQQMGVPQLIFDLRSKRRLRERDREPYIAIQNIGAGTIIIDTVVNCLFRVR